MSTPSPMAPSADFKNRRGGLIAFGVFEILIACMCLLFVPLMFFGIAVQASQTNAQADYSMLIPSVVIYVLMAAVFLTLGIGSIRCRRWARSLMLILSWSWLLIGVVSVTVDAFILPRMMTQTVGSTMGSMILIMTFAMLGVIFILLPAAFVLFYSSRHVKATCEAYTPKPGWTDRCPLPVLAAALWFAFGAFSLITMPLTYNVIPLFGKVVAGVPATIVLLTLAVLWAWLAIGFYQLKRSAWLIGIGAFLILMLSAIISFWQIDLIDFYRQMHMPEAQLEQIKKMDFFTGRNMSVFMAIFAVPMFGFMIWIRKFFRR